ncbi:hypothetical protein MMC17_005244 [Xylographa soralifera]|nr:hypothetical protein [Xylographa soralifera]
MVASDSKANDKNCGLVQTTLTPAFGLSRDGRNGMDAVISPYLTKSFTDANTLKNGSSQTSSAVPSLSLFPERHAKASEAAATNRRSSDLAAAAAETKSLLPSLLACMPTAKPYSIHYSAGQNDIHGLCQSRCPNLKPSPIRVLNADTLDTALTVSPSAHDRNPVLILNMANAKHGGGGWLKGALAQEEALCYRSSLSFTLKRRYYPLRDEDAIYSPRVVVIRDSLCSGHGLLDLSQPQKLPIVSVVSVAAIRDPELVAEKDGMETYKFAEDEKLMTTKIRTALRIAGKDGHRRLVLGALGCGAFGNPRRTVARLWKAVLGEREFFGWFESVVFAVLEHEGTKDGNGNFGVFFRALDGMMV